VGSRRTFPVYFSTSLSARLRLLLLWCEVILFQSITKCTVSKVALTEHSYEVAVGLSQPVVNELANILFLQ
jgi:hypothetical protein